MGVPCCNPAINDRSCKLTLEQSGSVVKTFDAAMTAEGEHAARLETPKQDPKKIEEISSLVNAAAAAAGRQCGDCSMCCKVIRIEEEGISKPAHQWCQHARPGSGCAIYETRPAACRTFACCWLILKDMGPHWKPTECRMVLVHKFDHQSGGRVIFVHLDRNYPDAWRRSPYYEELKARCGQTRIEIIVTDRCRVLMCPDQDVYFDPDIEAVMFDGSRVKGVLPIEEARKLGQLRKFQA
jgi:Fe-S-cluster containining protein